MSTGPMASSFRTMSSSVTSPAPAMGVAIPPPTNPKRSPPISTTSPSTNLMVEGKRLLEKRWVVDVSVCAETDRRCESLPTFPVFGHHCLVDRGSDVITPFPHDLCPSVAHRGVVPGGPVPGYGNTEFASEDVGDDALTGPVVEKVDQVAEDQDDLSATDHLFESVEGTVNV